MREGPFREPVWRDARVLGVVRRHVPGARAVTGLDDERRDFRVYEIDQAMVLEVARRHLFRRTTSLLREAIWLARAPAGARVPKTLGSGIAYGTEYGLETLVRGVPLQGTTLAGWPQTGALLQLGATLALLHGAALAPDERALFPVVSMDGLRRQSVDDLEDLLALCPEIDARHVRRKLEQAWSLLPASLPEVVVHGALTTRNVLVDPATGALAALVDLADARRGPAALDLAAIWPSSVRTPVLEGYRTVAPLPPGLDALSGALGLLAALRKHRARREAKADTLMVRRRS
jgi:aminoglycoside phosphotransferase (APT) family kinase protein